MTEETIIAGATRSISSAEMSAYSANTIRLPAGRSASSGAHSDIAPITRTMPSGTESGGCPGCAACDCAAAARGSDLRPPRPRGRSLPCSSPPRSPGAARAFL